MAKEEVKSIVFKNFTDEEFVCSWDGVPYRFLAGKEMFVEDWKAEHFANHLVNRVMNKLGMITTNMVERKKFLAEALPTGESLSPIEALDINTRAEVKAKKTSKVVKEEEFKGLKK